MKDQVCPTLGCCRVSVTTDTPLLPKLAWSSGAATVVGSVSCLCSTPLQSTAPGTAAGSEHWLLEAFFARAAANLLFPFWMFLVAFRQRPALHWPRTAFCQGPWGCQLHYCGAEMPSPLPALGMSLLHAAGDTGTAKPQGCRPCQEKHQEHTV